MQVTLELEKETKNTYRYKETENDTNLDVVLATIYIKKSAMKNLSPDGPAKKLLVTIKEA